MTQKQLTDKGDGVFMRLANAGLNLEGFMCDLQDWVQYDYPYDTECITNYKAILRDEAEENLKEIHEHLKKYVKALADVEVFMKELKAWRAKK